VAVVTLPLFRGAGGEIVLPANLVLVDRLDGGHLCVNPPREVWERSELTPEELTQWSFLVAATGRAMLETLPQLHEGCVNYWEAGNWSLHDQAEPAGLKIPRRHRRVHLHLLGRSRSARSPDWKWGEAPRFPDFADRFAWAAAFKPLEPEECRAIVARAAEILRSVYGVRPRG
jgi:diadenosine tetraphosphate (Ap4A) HIT family hydrolase